ncbi:helicase family protein [Actinoalloteichus sp. GBA129-24]|nr:helicase family protein [Actinoalloteichus sp. GBA129-24]
MVPCRPGGFGGFALTAISPDVRASHRVEVVGVLGEDGPMSPGSGIGDPAGADAQRGLELFSPATRDWFGTTFPAPTSAQTGAWRAAARGGHALVIAPTGAGKTLAAFLWALDRLAVTGPPAEPRARCRVLYVSPMKALAVDVERNLRGPLAGIGRSATRLGLPAPDITVGMRTGDTDSATRRGFNRTPPDVLVTTPESLFLLVTSAARESLRGVATVIVDEVHAVAGGKRGAHLAVSLERLDALLVRPAQRIGLSATVRPVEEITTFLAAGAPVEVVRPVHPKEVAVRVEVPVADMSRLDEQQAEPVPPAAPANRRRGAGPGSSRPAVGAAVEDAEESGATSSAKAPAGGEAAAVPAADSVPSASIWPAVERRVLDLVRAHRSTIVFVNSRRLAERLTARLNELVAEETAAQDGARLAGPELDGEGFARVDLDRLSDLDGRAGAGAAADPDAALGPAEPDDAAEGDGSAGPSAETPDVGGATDQTSGPQTGPPTTARTPGAATGGRAVAARPGSAGAALAGAGRPAGPVRFPAEAVGQSGVATGAPSVIAKAHHGSMARAQRTEVEEELKAGMLPCVVATSSLELGIDMGAVDLVIQVEAPPSVAAGLQRVGRAGHHVDAVSTGVVLPKFRGDLVSCAIVAERMRSGAIEEIRFPRNPLDVLAQHIVAMVAMEPWSVAELAALVRRAAPFTGLPDSALHAVLDMLAGRYPSEEFGELRARIVWDRTADVLHARPGAQRLAVTSGGTIPDRGLFTVTTPGGEGEPGARVGELDEEMVYESRVGDTFLLGTSSWRVQEITHDRVIVTPAPGLPARMPFWKGDSPGRPLELGIALGGFVREIVAADPDSARRRAEAAGLDVWACDNLLAYLAEQRAATGRVPDDRTVLLERFRDELGDWQWVLHSPFGDRVNAPWALLIAARLRDRLGVDPQLVHSDDGIVLRLPAELAEEHGEHTVAAEDVLFEPDEVERLVSQEVGSSALFAARFRECAARSLLLPRWDPRRRSPLWRQRQRSAQLLTVAARYDQFPVMLETMRECLRDVYDLPGLVTVFRDASARRVEVVEVETRAPSPFARALLVGYVAMFLYGEDVPLAERRAAGLTLDATLLGELLGSEAVRDLLDPTVLAEVEAALQRTDPEYHVTDAEGVADLLRFLGDLGSEEIIARGGLLDWVTELVTAGRAIEVIVAGERRWIAVEDAARYRDALGTTLPAGLPAALLTATSDALGDLLIRFARGRGPFRAAEAAARFGLGVGPVTDRLDRLRVSGRLVRGELRPVEAETAIPGGLGTPTEYCDAEVLRRLRRGSLARLRAEVEPVEPAALGRFLPDWHGVLPAPPLPAGPEGTAPGLDGTSVGADDSEVGAARRGRGADGGGTASTARSRVDAASPDEVLAVIEQLAGAPLPASAVESMILGARLPDYRPAALDELTAAGEVVWCGCGPLGAGDGWLALAPADLAELILPPPAAEDPVLDTDLHRALLTALASGGLFFRGLVERIAAWSTDRGEPRQAEGDLVTALWQLVWAGLVTNDTLAPLRALLGGGAATHRPRRQAPRGRRAGLRVSRHGRPMLGASGPPTVAGRWSLVPVRETDPTRRAHAQAEALLARHGVLTRGAVEGERVPGGFAGVYRVLRAMEESGRCRRGLLVRGPGGAQFAVPGAVDGLRAFSREAGRLDGRPAASVLAAADPAQPYGAALPWPASIGAGGHRPGRKAGALIALVDGEPVLYVERGGKSLLSFTEDETALRTATAALVDVVRSGRTEPLVLSRADGEQALGSRLAAVLQQAGFRATPKGLRLRG